MTSDHVTQFRSCSIKLRRQPSRVENGMPQKKMAVMKTKLGNQDTSNSKCNNFFNTIHCKLFINIFMNNFC